MKRRESSTLPAEPGRKANRLDPVAVPPPALGPNRFRRSRRKRGTRRRRPSSGRTLVTSPPERLAHRTSALGDKIVRNNKAGKSQALVSGRDIHADRKTFQRRSSQLIEFPPRLTQRSCQHGNWPYNCSETRIRLGSTCKGGDKYRRKGFAIHTRYPSNVNSICF